MVISCHTVVIPKVNVFERDYFGLSNNNEFSKYPSVETRQRLAEAWDSILDLILNVLEIEHKPETGM